MIKLMGMVEIGKPAKPQIQEAGRIPKLFLKMEAVKREIKRLENLRKDAVVPYNKETDTKRKEELKQPLIKYTQQIKTLQTNLVNLYDMEEKYIQDLDKNTELDIGAAN